MNRRTQALRLLAGLLALCGAAVAWAQETPAVKDPISPEECRKDRMKTLDCMRLGLLYGEGKEVPADLDKSIAFLDAACRYEMLGNACQAKAWMLLKRKASPKDVADGLKILEKWCKQRPPACALLGRAYAEGHGIQRDPLAAMRHLQAPCEDGEGMACAAMATLLASGDGVPRDEAQAKGLTSRACHLGHLPACESGCDAGDKNVCMAWVFRLEERGAGNRAAVEGASRRACAAGAAFGCLTLAGWVKDLGEALALRERACTLGDPDGCAAAGKAYYLGGGAAVDLAASARFFEKACEKDHDKACAILGGLYARGELGADQKDKARPYFTKACARDTACEATIESGGIPQLWGGSLEALRPDVKRMVMRGPVRVGGAIPTPRRIREVPVVYPLLASTARIQGRVELECLISDAGEVLTVHPVKSIPMLDAAAIRALREYQYEPTLVNGRPVPVLLRVVYEFRLGNEKAAHGGDATVSAEAVVVRAHAAM